MNIEKHIETLHEARLKAKNTDELNNISLMLRFACAKKSNHMDSFRASEIARKVSEKYSIDRQIEILLYGDPSEIAMLKSYRGMITAEVDLLIKNLEKELT